MPARPVLCDHREALSGIPESLEAAGIPVQATQLPAGDYIVSDRVAVERKTGADLAASIKDRRLFEQLDRLADAYPAVVLVVEGEPVHIGEASWKGALARVLIAAGVSVIQTNDPNDTAAWITRFRLLERKGPSAPRGLPRVRRPTEDIQRNSEDVLTCLPGISTVGARRLLAHFGSLAAVYTATANELREVPGIGPTRAAALAQLFAGSRDAGPTNPVK
ncbi:MAG: helix-hairpin-helix domain-containing protein [Actinomycetota bacterium]|nr:helix-hairpin-helix domain-containing protein [Actinomycetota bacterium]